MSALTGNAGGSSATLTGAQIKAAYEAQNDTNAFDDAAKFRLSQSVAFMPDTADALLLDEVGSYAVGIGKIQLSAGRIFQTMDGHSYEVAGQTAPDNNLVTAGGIKLYQLPREGKFSAAAAGITKGIASHATAFAALVERANGRPILFTPGEYSLGSADYSAANLICYGMAWDSGNSTINIEDIGLVVKPVTITVGVEVPNLNAAFEHVLHMRFAYGGNVTIQLPPGVSEFIGGGVYSFTSPEKIQIRGSSMLAPIPTNDALIPLTKAEAIVLVRASFDSIIEVRKPIGGSASNGAFLPRGIGFADEVCIHNIDCRYGIMFGNFTGSFTGRFGPSGAATLNSCAVIGGTWGMQGVNSEILLTGINLFGLQEVIDGKQPGGGIRMQGRGAFLHNGNVGSSLSTRIIQKGSGLTGPQVAIQIQEGGARLGFGSLDAVGGRHTIIVDEDANLIADGALLRNGQHVAVLENSSLDITGAVISGYDASLANLSEGDGLENHRALIAIGANCHAELGAMSVSGCEAQMLIYNYCGKATGTKKGIINVDDCKWYDIPPTDLYEIGLIVTESGGHSSLRFNVTGSRSGSLDLARTREAGQNFLTGSSGISAFDPALSGADHGANHN